MLIINKKDITKAVSRKDIIEAVENALSIYARGEANMPDRMHVSNEQNTLLLMPCFADDHFSTKLVSVFPDNTSKGMEVIHGCLVLNDGTSGAPLALIDAASLTAHRTGALGGVAAKHLSPVDVVSLGLIGTGVQGFYQCLYICAVRNISQIFIYNKSADKMGPFVSSLQKELPDVQFIFCNNARNVVEHSEIIVTATSSQVPVVPDLPQLYKNKTIIAVGSYTPTMREIPEAVLHHVNKIYVDTIYAMTECGDLAIPLKDRSILKEDIVPLGKYIQSPSELTGDTQYFKSVGMAILDLCSAKTIYNEALKKGIGTQVEF